MKKSFSSLILLCLLFSKITSFGQVTSASTSASTPVTSDFSYTQMVDSLMAPLNKTQITTGILYDRVFPFAYLQSFNRSYNNPDTSSYGHFYQAYSEIYNAAYNKTNLMNDYRLDTLAKAIYYTKNIIPISTLYYDVNIIDTSSVAKNLLYNGADSLMHDVAGRTGSPYTLNTVTAAAALATDTLSYGTGNFQFKFYSRLFFTNKGVTLSSITVNFGAGSIDMTTGNIVTANFTTGGTKTIQFTMTYSNGQAVTTYSKIFIRSNAAQRYGVPVNPDETRNIADMQYGFQGYDETAKKYNSGTYSIYYHRTSPGGPIERILKKPIILVDGFDPTDERHEDKIYGLYLQYTPTNNFGSEMRDKGYDVIVLNFTTIVERTVTISLLPNWTFSYPVYRYQGADYMQRNAFLVVTLIESINKELAANSSAEKLIVVGPSMGGLITRYALKWMENNGHPHNTKLWISLDAPHKGANISIGDQHFLDFFARKAGNKGAQEARDLQINSVAAKQLLLHHYLGNYGALNSLPVGAPGFRDRWQQEIDALGYPSNLRKIAVVNGAINGTVQGQACQKMLDMQAFFRINLFFFKIGRIRVAKAAVSFTGSYANYCEVFDGWAKVWFNTNGRSAAAPSASQSYDIVPGGYYSTQQEIVEKGRGYEPLVFGYSFGVGTSTKFNVIRSTHSFIPTYSSLGIDLTNKDLAASLYGRNLICSGETPFDSYYGPQNNEDHISLTTGNVSWLTKEIDGIPQPPTYNYTGTYAIQLVSGSEPLCTGSNVYTVTNIPTGATITWQTSPAGIANVSYSGAGTQVSVNRITNGSFSLIATLSFCNKPAMAVVSRSINAGPPSVSISYSPNGSCNNGYQTWSLSASSPSTVTSWQWTVDNPSSGSWYINSPGMPSTFVDVKGGGGISVTATSSCGTGKNGVTIYSNCPAFAIAASPNPATNEVTVATVEPTSMSKAETNTQKNKIYGIEIVDRFGNIKKKFSYAAGVTSTKINVSSLVSGTYIIHAYNGKVYGYKQVVVVH